MAIDRRPTVWEQSVGSGDYCELCAMNACAQRKEQTASGWQACPHCDRAVGCWRPPGWYAVTHAQDPR